MLHLITDIQNFSECVVTINYQSEGSRSEFSSDYAMSEKTRISDSST